MLYLNKNLNYKDDSFQTEFLIKSSRCWLYLNLLYLYFLFIQTEFSID